MPKVQPESVRERITDGAADAAAELTKEDRRSTWGAIVRRNPAAIPTWKQGRERAAEQRRAVK